MNIHIDYVMPFAFRGTEEWEKHEDFKLAEGLIKKNRNLSQRLEIITKAEETYHVYLKNSIKGAKYWIAAIS